MKPFLPRLTNAKTIAAFVVSVVFFYSNVLTAHSAESAFWSERRNAANRMKKGSELSATPSALGLAAEHNRGLSAEQHQLLAQLPRATNMDFGMSESVTNGLSSLGKIPREDLKAAARGEAKNTPTWISSLILPYGAIRDVYLSKSPNAPIIVHIQDAHGIEDAQRNMASMIQGLKEERGINLVGLEGAQGDFALGPYRAFSDAAITRGIADYFMRDGTIGGPEYVGITAPQPPLLWGVEDLASYESNIQAFKDSVKYKPAVSAFLTELKDALSRLKTKAYSRELREFDQHYSDYKNQRESLGAYVRYLMEVQNGGDLRFANLKILLNALDWEESLDFKKVEAERLQLVETMAKKFSEEQLSHLVQQSLLYRLGRMGYGDYHRFLRTLCRDNKIDLDLYPQLNSYITYVLLAEQINRNELLVELSGAEQSAQDALAATPEQRKLVAVNRNLILLEKLTQHAMTMPDWLYFDRNKPDILKVSAVLEELAGPLDVTLALTPVEAVPMPAPPDVKGGNAAGPGTVPFSTMLQPYEDFCRYAMGRNNSLLDNLLEKIRAENASSAVLVAGGFHTEGLTQLLRQKDVSYVVVTPKINEVPKENNYLDVFAHDPLPIEKMFAGEKIYLVAPRLLSAKVDLASIAAKRFNGLYAGMQVSLSTELREVLEQNRDAIESKVVELAAGQIPGVEGLDILNVTRRPGLYSLVNLGLTILGKSIKFDVLITLEGKETSAEALAGKEAGLRTKAAEKAVITIGDQRVVVQVHPRRNRWSRIAWGKLFGIAASATKEAKDNATRLAGATRSRFSNIFRRKKEPDEPSRPFSSKDAMVKELPRKITAELRGLGLNDGEIARAAEMMEMVHDLYSHPGMHLLTDFQHNHAHNLAVVYESLLFARSRNLPREEAKRLFLIALFHDFHVREIPQVEDAKKDPARFGAREPNVAHTIDQLRDMLGLPASAVPDLNKVKREPLYDEIIGAHDKARFRSLFTGFLDTADGLEKAFVEIEGGILYTDYDHDDPSHKRVALRWQTALDSLSGRRQKDIVRLSRLVRAADFLATPTLGDADYVPAMIDEGLHLERPHAEDSFENNFRVFYDPIVLNPTPERAQGLGIPDLVRMVSTLPLPLRINFINVMENAAAQGSLEPDFKRKGYEPLAEWRVRLRGPVLAKVFDNPAFARKELLPLLEDRAIRVVPNAGPNHSRVAEDGAIELSEGVLSSETATALALRRAAELAVLYEAHKDDKGSYPSKDSDEWTAFEVAATQAELTYLLTFPDKQQRAHTAGLKNDRAKQKLVSNFLRTVYGFQKGVDRKTNVVLYLSSLYNNAPNIDKPVDLILDSLPEARSGVALIARSLSLFALPTELLLTLGGDSRLVVDWETGENGYGSSPISREVISYASTTSSDITPAPFKAAEAKRRDLLRESLSRPSDVRSFFARQMGAVPGRFKKHLGVTERGKEDDLLSFTTPSGTDIELLFLSFALNKMTSLNAAGKKIRGVVNMPTEETGSGTFAMTEGAYGDDLTPDGTYEKGRAGDKNAKTAAKSIPGFEGKPVTRQSMPIQITDQEVEQRVDKAVQDGMLIVLHLTLDSKTGKTGPSPYIVRTLQERYPDNVLVVVDAAQSRMVPTVARKMLDMGWFVFSTGSKFWGGAPFSGIGLVPEQHRAAFNGMKDIPGGLGDFFTRHDFSAETSWAENLPDRMNVGLLLRWETALHNIEDFMTLENSDPVQLKKSNELILDLFNARLKSGDDIPDDRYLIVDQNLTDIDKTLQRLFFKVFRVFKKHVEQSEQKIISLLSKDPLDHPTARAGVNAIIPFTVRFPEGGEILTPDQYKKLLRYLRADLSDRIDVSYGQRHIAAKRFLLGQGVDLGGGQTAVRLSLSAPWTSRIYKNILSSLSSGKAREKAENEVISSTTLNVQEMIGKIELIINNWDQLERESAPASAARMSREERYDRYIAPFVDTLPLVAVGFLMIGASSLAHPPLMNLLASIHDFLPVARGPATFALFIGTLLPGIYAARLTGPLYDLTRKFSGTASSDKLRDRHIKRILTLAGLIYWTLEILSVPAGWIAPYLRVLELSLVLIIVARQFVVRNNPGNKQMFFQALAVGEMLFLFTVTSALTVGIVISQILADGSFNPIVAGMSTLIFVFLSFVYSQTVFFDQTLSLRTKRAALTRDSPDFALSVDRTVQHHVAWSKTVQDAFSLMEGLIKALRENKNVFAMIVLLVWQIVSPGRKEAAETVNAAVVNNNPQVALYDEGHPDPGEATEFVVRFTISGTSTGNKVGVKKLNTDIGVEKNNKLLGWVRDNLKEKMAAIDFEMTREGEDAAGQEGGHLYSQWNTHAFKFRGPARFDLANSLVQEKLRALEIQFQQEFAQELKNDYLRKGLDYSGLELNIGFGISDGRAPSLAVEDLHAYQARSLDGNVYSRRLMAEKALGIVQARQKLLALNSKLFRYPELAEGNANLKTVNRLAAKYPSLGLDLVLVDDVAAAIRTGEPYDTVVKEHRELIEDYDLTRGEFELAAVLVRGSIEIQDNIKRYGTFATYPDLDKIQALRKQPGRAEAAEAARALVRDTAAADVPEIRALVQKQELSLNDIDALERLVEEKIRRDDETSPFDAVPAAEVREIKALLKKAAESSRPLPVRLLRFIQNPLKFRDHWITSGEWKRLHQYAEMDPRMRSVVTSVVSFHGTASDLAGWNYFSSDIVGLWLMNTESFQLETLEIALSLLGTHEDLDELAQKALHARLSDPSWLDEPSRKDGKRTAGNVLVDENALWDRIDGIGMRSADTVTLRIRNMILKIQDTFPPEQFDLIFNWQGDEVGFAARPKPGSGVVLTTQEIFNRTQEIQNKIQSGRYALPKGARFSVMTADAVKFMAETLTGQRVQWGIDYFAYIHSLSLFMNDAFPTAFLKSLEKAKKPVRGYPWILSLEKSDRGQYLAGGVYVPKDIAKEASAMREAYTATAPTRPRIVAADDIAPSIRRTDLKISMAKTAADTVAIDDVLEERRAVRGGLSALGLRLTRTILPNLSVEDYAVGIGPVLEEAFSWGVGLLAGHVLAAALGWPLETTALFVSRAVFSAIHFDRETEGANRAIAMALSLLAVSPVFSGLAMPHMIAATYALHEFTNVLFVTLRRNALRRDAADLLRALSSLKSEGKQTPSPEGISAEAWAALAPVLVGGSPLVFSKALDHSLRSAQNAAGLPDSDRQRINALITEIQAALRANGVKNAEVLSPLLEEWARGRPADIRKNTVESVFGVSAEDLDKGTENVAQALTRTLERAERRGENTVVLIVKGKTSLDEEQIRDRVGELTKRGDLVNKLLIYPEPEGATRLSVLNGWLKSQAGTPQLSSAPLIVGNETDFRADGYWPVFVPYDIAAVLDKAIRLMQHVAQFA